MAKWLFHDSVGLFSRNFRAGIAATVIASSLFISSKALAENVGLEEGRKINISAISPIDVRARQMRNLADTATALIDKNPVVAGRASNLLQRTAIHESAGMKYLEQPGGGPAVSYFQIEPATAQDIVQRWARNKAPEMALLERTSGLTREKLLSLTKEELAEQLKNKGLFSGVVARYKYRMNPEAIPEGLKAQADYWGKHYQTTSDPKKISRFIENNTQFNAQVKNTMKKTRLIDYKTGGLVNKVLHKNKVNHTIKNILTKTRHLFKVR